MTAAEASFGSNITLELAVRRRRRWEVVANYSVAEREDALEDARKLEKEGGVDGVTVTKETWRQSENRYDTTVIYRSEALEKELAKQRAKDAAANPRPKAKPTPVAASKPATGDKAPRPARPRQPAPKSNGVSFARALPLMAISFLVSCILGAVIAVGLSFPLSQAAGMGVQFSRETFNLILIASFVIVAGTTFSILLRRILKRIESGPPAGHARPVAAAPAHELPPMPAMPPATTPATAPTPVPTAPVALTPAPVEEPPPAPVEEPAPAEAPLADAADAAPDDDPIVTLAGFALEVQRQLDNTPRGLDAAQRFAVALYLTGAAERLGADKDVPRERLAPALAEQLRTVGIGGDRAATFRDRLDEYLDQPRCVAVYQGGRDALARHLDEDPAAIDVKEMLATWDRPATAAKAEKKDDVMAVMFTDIVGSTKTTQELGDDAAQAIVRTHNHIVREVLKRLDGHEVKHTGDGIMASFAVPSRAVDAAVAIQVAVGQHNEADAKRAFGLRIGINAGEPIREDGDLFGATVQLAARLCAKADEGETIVSGVVRGLCTGKKHRFDSRGTPRLKGFNDPVELFAVALPADDTADAA